MRHALAYAAAILVLSSYSALSDPCTANAGMQAHKLPQYHMWQFSGDVQASGCVKYICTGWVSYVVTTRSSVGGSMQERLVDQYWVQPRNSSTHISNSHSLQGEDVIDIGVEKVSCSSP